MMNDQDKKQQRNSWIILGSILVLVGGLLTTWVIRFDDILAYDRVHGQPANLPFGSIQQTIQSLGQLWEEKNGGSVNNLVGSDQNQGQTGQLTNAGLTNEQIDTIENDLFDSVAPQQ